MPSTHVASHASHDNVLETTNGLILPILAEEPLSSLAAEVDARLEGLIGAMLERREFRAELGETVCIAPLGRIPCDRLLLVGLGPRADFSPVVWARATAAACRALPAHGIRSAALDLRAVDLPHEIAAMCAAEGAELSSFVPDSYKTSPRRNEPLSELTLYCDSEIEDGISEGCILGLAKNLARELVNEPGNVLTPSELAARSARAAEGAFLEIQVLDERQLEVQQMGGILAVTRGSAEPACLIVLAHLPNPGVPALALVGKAVTFDTGGISLKPRENMHAMKGDMAGGAAVIGAMQAIAALGLPVNVIGVVPAADNMPGSRAWKPGDIVTTRRGKTVETISTDAEGRMLLADALDYAQHLGAERIVDIATLTGSCVIALGRVASGLYGNDAGLIEAVRECGEQAGELHWPMPLFREYRALNKSDIADLKNSGGRYGGSIAAAWFLREFVDDRPWAHLDIAGTSWQDKATAWAPAGPTGVGVGTFVNLAKLLAHEIS